MSIPKKKYRKKEKNMDSIDYSEEEAEILGIELEPSEEFEEEIEEDIDEDFEEDIQKEIVVEDTKPEKKKRGRKPKNNVDTSKYYVDPKEFDQQILDYYKSGVLSDNLAEMVYRIAHKLSYASNFINYSYREEMVGDGVIRMFKALMSKKYSHDKGTNPFSYFTRIAFNAFRNRIKKEKHIHETHEKYQSEVLMFSENYNNMAKNNRTKGYKKDV
jgi:hypothetical protein